MGPQNIDMSAIREAMMRRRQGGAMPAGQQMTQPTAPSATGGMPVPTQQPAMPQPTGQNITPRQGSLGGGRAGPANVDDETRQISKALVKKLLQFL